MSACCSSDSGQIEFELYALRTYAASTWDWLIDAALPYGYEVFSA